MTEEIGPIDTLITARNKLVEERRALTVDMALGYTRRRNEESYTNNMRKAFIGIQVTIEAIERAIAHEKMITSGSRESVLVPILETVPYGEFHSDNKQ